MAPFGQIPRMIVIRSVCVTFRDARRVTIDLAHDKDPATQICNLLIRGFVGIRGARLIHCSLPMGKESQP